MPETCHIVILTEAGLPKGWAASTYVRLLARGLAHAGATVEILIPWHTEDGHAPLNTCTTGMIGGIPFEYTTGTPLRPETLTKRVHDIVRAQTLVVRKLMALKRSGLLGAVIYYGNHSENQLLYSALCRHLKVPLISYLVEYYPAIPRKTMVRDIYDKVFHRLALTTSDAFIVISDFLLKQVSDSSCPSKPVIKVPILSDAETWKDMKPAVRDKPYVVYCANLDGYLDDALFIVEAMAALYRIDIDLLLIGQASIKTIEHIRSHALMKGLASTVTIIPDYVPQEELLGLYAGAEALLAPLHDDDRSLARFPSKVADYLLSGRPVVSCDMGEVSVYLSDKKTAFLSSADNVGSYARTLQEALSSPEKEAVGAAGRGVAADMFDYRVQGMRVFSFIRKLTSRPCVE